MKEKVRDIFIIEFNDKVERESFLKLLKEKNINNIGENIDFIQEANNIIEEVKDCCAQSILSSYTKEVFSYLLPGSQKLMLDELIIKCSKDYFDNTYILYRLETNSTNNKKKRKLLKLKDKLYNLFSIHLLSSSKLFDEIGIIQKDFKKEEIVKLSNLLVDKIQLNLQKKITNEKRLDIAKNIVVRLNERASHNTKFELGLTMPIHSNINMHSNISKISEIYPELSFPEIIIVMKKEQVGNEEFKNMIIRLEDQLNEATLIHDKHINLDKEKKYVNDFLKKELKKTMLRERYV